MTSQKIKDLLTQLHDAMADVDEPDQETKQLLVQLDTDIHRALQQQEAEEAATDDEDDDESLIDRARELESKFAVQHPVAEKLLRDIIDGLGRMGV